jgi:uncharacterized peroxidase-related enzyme
VSRSSRFETVDPGDDPELAAAYEAMMAEYPFIPNWFKAMSSRPDLILASGALSKAIMGQGMLPRSLKELTIVAISMNADCGYCSAAHRMMARQAGIDEEVIDGLMHGVNKSKLLPTQRSVVDFALKCASDPQSLVDADFSALREQAGLVDAEIAELVLVIGFARLINTWADAAGLELDEVLRT